jgi:hypothetical protein
MMSRGRINWKTRLLLPVIGLVSVGAGAFLGGGWDRIGLNRHGALEAASSPEMIAPAADGPMSVAFEPAAAREPLTAATAAEPDADEPRILVSLAKRRLWYVKGRDTLLSAPIAVGKGEDFVFEGKKFHFATPRGQRKVLAKVPNPVWIPPEWHYMEKASRRGLELVRLDKDSKIELEDGSFIVVKEDTVGRVNQLGYFAPFTPGNEIIFDGKIFVPPQSSIQRRVPDALGPYKLDTGDGYLIHGTHMYNSESIGQAVSHGCIRMDNSDLEQLYKLVPRGTTVVIF